MAVDAVVHTKYVANSRVSIEALKSANLLKSLNINALIMGEHGVGKKTLCKYIMSNSAIVDGSNLQDILTTLSTQDNVIITNFHLISNYQKIKSSIDMYKTRIIATSPVDLPERLGDDFFSLKIVLQPLSERKEDIEPLANKFLKEVFQLFGDGNYYNIPFKDLKLDISDNCYSLKKSVYLHYLINKFKDEDVMYIMEQFLDNKIGGRNDYRDQLYLFDVPMIRSGFKKFHSQLSMSDKFGLNRNTLRKKINEYKDKYQLD